MNPESLSLGGAFLGGLVSFFSPCVAPLVPGYVAYMAADGGETNTGRRIGTAAVFVLGFTFVFVLLGAGASLLGIAIDEHRRTLNRLAGGFMVVMGVALIGLAPRMFARDVRFHVSREQFGPAAPLMLGMAFGLGWTPCIGPVLASILALAALGETAGEGARLLFAFSLGLGVPFVAVAFGLDAASQFVRAMGAWLGRLNLAAGVGMIAMGILFLTDQFFLVSVLAQRGAAYLSGAG